VFATYTYAAKEAWHHMIDI